MNLHSFKETRRLKPIEWIEPKRSAILKHSTFMTSKKWFQRIGGFDESFGSVDMTEIGIVRILRLCYFYVFLACLVMWWPYSYMSMFNCWSNCSETIHIETTKTKTNCSTVVGQFFQIL